ncbi:subtilisin-like protein [Thozetella sp. PMI_491]|nr:subtilisin-like protein [Thozetella sp. PMI_491]
MRIATDAEAEWSLLTTVYPVFHKSLSLKEGDDYSMSSVARNALSMMRISVGTIPLKMHEIQTSQFLTDFDFEAVLSALHGLLRSFETLVDHESMFEQSWIDLVKEEEVTPKDFPKLAILKEVLKTPGIGRDTDDARSNASSWDLVMLEQSASDIIIERLRKRILWSWTQSDWVPLMNSMSEFDAIIREVFHESWDLFDGRFASEYSFTDDDVAMIKSADAFGSSSEELFTLLAKSTTCPNPHDAKIHLSGFLDQQLHLLIADCEHAEWHHANARRSTSFPLQSILANRISGICDYLEKAQEVKIAFNEGKLWQDKSTVTSLDRALSLDDTPTLDALLSSTAADGKMLFDNQDEKVLQVALAYSLLHLYKSRWLRQALARERINLAGAKHALGMPSRWEPYVSCTLQIDDEDTELEKDDQDTIISFGILLLEMEARQRAVPSEADFAWGADYPSQDLILDRILAEWGRTVDDGYRSVARACLHLQDLAEGLYHPDLSEDMRKTAAIHKYILSPLLDILKERFSRAFRLFTAAATRKQKKDSGSKASVSEQEPVNLFDDEPAKDDPELEKRADSFFTDISPFLRKIAALSATARDLPEWRKEKIRIGVIDSGIDRNDRMISSALKTGRIAETLDLVDPEKDCQDQHGHGTHVARLLLKVAPTAQLYVAKISGSKKTPPSEFHRIVKAIKWCQEQKVHILSLSFGLDKRDPQIDKAISDAYKSDIIIFAAAANSGARRPRAHPASRSQVFCIHASDGNGNDGGISPAPIAGLNISTLGMSVKDKWQGKEVRKSGTSFATPIAAGLIANVLEFAKTACPLEEEEYELLFDYDTIQGIIRLLSQSKDGYDFLFPLPLFSGNWDDASREIMRLIRG